MKVVIVLEQAEEDLLAAQRFFEAEREGLGDSFVDKAEEAVEGIQRFPYAAPKLARGFRIWQLKKFRRYGLLYRVRREAIIVHRVIHLQRGPGFWKTVLR
jgi:toxin ParE1/3/4